MEDRRVESSPRGECRIGVQRVAVAAQPVEERLVPPGLVGDHVIGLAVGEFPVVGWSAVAAPAALAADEQSRSRGPEGGSIRIGDVGLHVDEGRLPLVVDLTDPAGGDALSGGRDLLVAGDRLLGMEQEHRVEVAEAGGPAPAHHHALGGERPLVHAVRILSGELQLEAGGVRYAGTDAECVDEALLGGPGDLGGFAHGSGGVGVDGHVDSSGSGWLTWASRAGPMAGREPIRQYGSPATGVQPRRRGLCRAEPPGRREAARKVGARVDP